MRPYELMNPARCREWLDLCASVAQTTSRLADCQQRWQQQTLRPSNRQRAKTFNDSVKELFADPRLVATLGYLLQWACEDNEGYARTFRLIAHGESALCPFHPDGLSFAVDVCNGLKGDRGIFTHRGQSGYVVVPGWQRQEADRRLDVDSARDWLHRRCGGARDASGLRAEVRSALSMDAFYLAFPDDELGAAEMYKTATSR